MPEGSVGVKTEDVQVGDLVKLNGLVIGRIAGSDGDVYVALDYDPREEEWLDQALSQPLELEIVPKVGARP